MSYLGTTKIGKMYLGNTGIAKAYLGNTLVFQNGGGPTPPPPTNVAYIRGGGDGSYIDTGITPDNTTKVIVWARNFQPGGGNLFGSRTSASSNRFCLLTPGAANAGRIRIDYGDASDTYADDQFANLSHYHKYELYQGVLKIDDVTIVSSPTQPTFSGTYNLFLFGNNNAGTLQSLNVPADICACQIYKGGTLVRDFTPVNSPSVGLYDAVGETVFTNAGSGAFSYGTFDSSAYTPLEYIECSGGQYFTTPESGKYSTRIVTKFRSTPPSAVWGHIIGGNNATQKCDVFTGSGSIRNARLYAILGTGSAGQIKSTSTRGYFDNRDIIVVKANNVFTGYESNASIGSVTGTTSTSFDTGIPMSVGALNNNGTITEHFYGRIYYVGVGGCNYVPAEVNNVAGMYDTYNDVFKPSETGVPFVAGQTI